MLVSVLCNKNYYFLENKVFFLLLEVIKSCNEVKLCVMLHLKDLKIIQLYIVKCLNLQVKIIA